MSWTAPYQIQSIERLCRNVIAVIERDQAAAMVWANPILPPVPFQYFGICRRVDQQVFPSCLVLPTRMPMNQNAELAGIEMRQELVIEIANFNSDPEKLASEILTRSRAVIAMVLGASGPDLFEGVSLNPLGNNAYGGLSWDIQELAINQFPRQNTQGHYLSISQLLAVFTYLEM
jgi:hypothetical protein